MAVISYRMRHIGPTLLVCLTASVVPAPPAADDGCGTSADLPGLLREQHAANLELRKSLASGAAALPGGHGDRIQSDLIVLEDRGDLVVYGRTDTMQILERAVALVGDRFDFITVLTASTFQGNVETEVPGAIAFYAQVNNDVGGTGLPLVQDPGLTILRGIVNMNDLDEYPDGPEGLVAGFNGLATGIEVLGQEASHWIGAYLDSAVAPILGRYDAHWSFYMNSQGSVLEGNRWLDNGDGTFTTAPAAGQFGTLSQLDLYLWGLLDPSEVTEPIFVITDPSENPGQGRFSFPQAGFTTAGIRRDIDITELVAWNGPRTPARSDAPSRFTMAFVLVVPFGEEPSPDDLAKAAAFRSGWESWFLTHTGGRGSFDTSIPDIPVGGGFSAVRQAGGPAPMTVQFRSHLHGSVTGVAWDFGDGTVSTEPNPEHTYVNNGVFTVKLRIDGFGGPVVIDHQGFVVIGSFSPQFLDDSETDRGWTAGHLDDATGGWWERADPQGTWSGGVPVQPEDDHTPGPASSCWTTGALAGASPGANDVDGGTTSLESPVFSLAGVKHAYLEFWYWYTNQLGAWPGEDTLRVDLSNDGGATWVTAAKISGSLSAWRYLQMRVRDVLPATDQMKVRFVASDTGGASLVEAALDDIAVIALPPGDRDLDGASDWGDNCPGLFNPYQEDADQDARGDACDCAPADGSVSAVPGEVGPTIELAASSGITWQPIPQATGYGLYRGLIVPTAPFSYDQTCLAPWLPGTEFSDPDTPPPGASFRYLVTGSNCFGEGPLGTDAGGDARPNTSPCL